MKGKHSVMFQLNLNLLGGTSIWPITFTIISYLIASLLPIVEKINLEAAGVRGIPFPKALGQGFIMCLLRV